MAIICTTNLPKTPEKFPRLMVNHNAEFIALILSENKMADSCRGIILSALEVSRIGEYSADFVLSELEDFHSPLIIINDYGAA